VERNPAKETIKGGTPIAASQYARRISRDYLHCAIALTYNSVNPS